MKKKLQIISIPVAFAIILLFVNFKFIYPSGSPGGYTGSPADGKTCTSCHGGTASSVSGWITSDIPAAGYTPGTVYNITVTIAAANSTKKGFEVSPQKTDGTAVGTIHSGTGSKLINSSKAVTHSSASTASNASWTFTWTAPAAGTGDVTFYGAFVAGYSNISKSTSLFHENLSSSVRAINENSLKIFPNPTFDVINVQFNQKEKSNVNISLYNLEGQIIQLFTNTEMTEGEKQFTFSLDNSLAKGNYLLKIESRNQNIVKQINISK
jgi:hypothetical protein